MDVNFYLNNAKNRNTTKATNTWYRNYEKWAKEGGIETKIEGLRKPELNDILEPTSLCAMQAGIDRYLKENGCNCSILKDLEFKGCRDVLEGRAKYLREELGMGKKPNRSHSLTLQEEEELWKSGQLGVQTGQSLTNAMWFLLTQHFGLRGRQEHHAMKVEDFVFKTDDDGNKFITFREGMTKTRGGGLHKKERLVVPKMFESGDRERCPVMIFETFLSRRPLQLRNTGSLYLAIIGKPQSDIWFKVSKLGVNSIDNIMKSMVTSANLETSKKLTNHSARKTVIKKLRKSGKSRSEIIEITGHSKERGLDPYDSGDECQQREMSLKIDQPGPSSSHLKTFSKDSLPQKRTFKLLSEEMEKKLTENVAGTTYNFFNCNVNISKDPEKQVTSCKKRVRVVYSSTESSQE